MEKEKDEDIWSRKIIHWQRRRKKIFKEGKYLFPEEKKKEDNIWRRKTEEKKKNEKGKGGTIWRRNINGNNNQPTRRI